MTLDWILDQKQKQFALKDIIDLAKCAIPGNDNQKVQSLVTGRKMRGEGHDCGELHKRHQL